MPCGCRRRKPQATRHADALWQRAQEVGLECSVYARGVDENAVSQPVDVLGFLLAHLTKK